MMERKATGYTGDALIGYVGLCTRCRKEQKAYWVYADRKHRSFMENGSMMSVKSNCPSCVTSPLFQSPHTVQWTRKMSSIEVEKDLRILGDGKVDINFSAIEDSLKAAKEGEEFDAWNNEVVAWGKKKGKL